MAKEQVSTNTAEGKGKFEAHRNSIPQCLQHSCNMEALKDAKQLAHFLGQAILGMGDDHGDLLDETAALGFNLCVTLLTDKLDILSGALEFPLVAYGNDAPPLCECGKGVSHE